MIDLHQSCSGRRMREERQRDYNREGELMIKYDRYNYYTGVLLFFFHKFNFISRSFTVKARVCAIRVRS